MEKNARAASSDSGPVETGRYTEKIGRSRRWRIELHDNERNTPFLISDKNGVPLDIDIGGDLAELKKNLAKFKKGKHGKGLADIDIEELDFVSKMTDIFIIIIF